MLANRFRSAETSANIAYTLGICDRKSLASTANERDSLKTLLKSSSMVKFMVREENAGNIMMLLLICCILMNRC